MTAPGDVSTRLAEAHAASPPMEGFPVVVRIPVLWGDMDALGHVNNARYFAWFESARIALFERVGEKVAIPAELRAALTALG